MGIINGVHQTKAKKLTAMADVICLQEQILNTLLSSQAVRLLQC